MKKILSSILIVAILLFVLSGCSHNLDYRGFGFMGTFYSMKGKGEIKQEQLDEMLNGIEKDVSATEQLKKVNDAKEGEEIVLSESCYDLVKLAFELSQDSIISGALNISLYPIVKLWGFDSSFDEFSELTPPDSSEIEEALTHVGADKFILNDEKRSVTKTDDKAALDLGAIGKGYAVSEVLKNYSYDNCIFNLGGTVGALGKSYEIGIESPFPSSGSYFATFTLLDGEVCATSGNYQRAYTFEGKTYHHIFADNGYPVDNDLVMVTVISLNGTISDALSTACYVLGEEASQKVLEKYEAKAVFVYKDKTVSTKNINIKIKDSDYKLK